MPTQDEVEKLRVTASSITSKPIDTLLRRPQWGDLDFAQAEPQLKRAYGLVGPLSDLPIEQLPDNIYNDIRERVRELGAQIDQIDTFRLIGGDPGPRRDSIIQELRGVVDRLYQSASPHIPYLAYQRGDIQAQLATLGSAIRQSTEHLAQAKEEMEAKTKALDGILTAAREAAAQAGAAVFVQDFDNEAKIINKQAVAWLWVSGGLAAAGLIAALAFLIWIPAETAPVSRLVQVSLSKILIVGTLLGSAVWCSSIYKALRHQASINRHRANGLKTFQAFSQAAKDDDAKQVVLLETVKSIFALAPSGFLNATETNADGGFKPSDALKLTKS